MTLPVYRIDISNKDTDSEEVDYIALVDRPAIEKNFLTFNASRKSFAITNEDEQIITGLAMVADMPIYRKDQEGEYYVFFDAPVIKKIAQRFFRKKYNFNLNLNHNPNAKTEGVYIFESWIVDREKGKPPMSEFSDVANGSWIVSAKVDNPEIWNEIKAGSFNGFSVEGLFKLERIPDTTSEENKFFEDFAAGLKKILRGESF